MKKIVIAPNFCQKNIIKKLTKEDPFLDLTLFSKEDLINDLYGFISCEHYSELINASSLPIEHILSITKIIPFLKEDKKLPDEVNNLISYSYKHDLIKKNKYIYTQFKDALVEIYYYSEKDRVLNEALNKLAVKPVYIKNNSFYKPNDVICYQFVENEVQGTLNKIASLVDSGVNIDDIYIYISNSNYTYYFKTFAKDFNLPINVNSSTSLYENKIALSFIDMCYKTKDIDESINSLDDSEVAFQIRSEIKKYNLDSLSFDRKMQFIVYLFKKCLIKEVKYKHAINLVNKPVFQENAHIFIVGFNEGDFPRNYTDNDIISDNLKILFNLETSKDKTLLERELITDFVKENKNVYPSFSQRYLTDKYQISPLAEEFGLQVKKYKMENVYYSNLYKENNYASLKDLNCFYGEISADYISLDKCVNIPYGDYNHSYTLVSAYNLYDELKLSYSKVNGYFKCPFSYYLDNILELNEFEENFHSVVGKIAHKVFEEQFKPGFDFDDVFESAKIEFTKNFTKKDFVFLGNLKPQIKKAVDANFEHLKRMKNPKVLTEKKVLKRIYPNLIVDGIIDKIVILDNKEYILVDYKTGSDSFDPTFLDYGLSLQLPTYAFLASLDDSLKDLELIGLYINNVLTNKFTYNPIGEEEIINDYLKLNGKTIDEIEKISHIDNTISGNKSMFIQSLNLKKNGEFNQYARIASQEEIKSYLEAARRKYLEANMKVHSNEFPIKPYYIDNKNNGCVYCTYKDICFHDRTDFLYIKEDQGETDGEED